MPQRLADITAVPRGDHRQATTRKTTPITPHRPTTVTGEVTQFESSTTQWTCPRARPKTTKEQTMTPRWAIGARKTYPMPPNPVIDSRCQDVGRPQTDVRQLTPWPQGSSDVESTHQQMQLRVESKCTARKHKTGMAALSLLLLRRFCFFSQPPSHSLAPLAQTSARQIRALPPVGAAQ